MPKDKPMLGLDDLLLLLTHLWARDTCVFLTKDQRYTLATFLLLSIFTGARPAELVDAMKHNAPHKYLWEDPEILLCDRFHVTTVILLSTIGATFSVFVFWGLSTTLPLLCIFAILYGVLCWWIRKYKCRRYETSKETGPEHGYRDTARGYSCRERDWVVA
jgi:hypothetical protein